jgi:cardiolipin synthase
MPTLIPWRATYMNLRNHRKILVVDGNMGFTGGMNIRVGHDLSRNSDHPVQDLHFRIEGPVVSQMMEAFAEDWHFSTNEQLKGDEWFPKLTPVGESVARGIKDGPDEDFEKLRFVILNAISNAHECVRIMSPYFLPDATLTTALNLAALRGIKVQIVIPSKNNLWLLQWATSAHLTMSLNEHCELYFSPPPFDHTKLILIDRTWCSLGSANWDPRSFRLNFEFNIETYDSVLVESLDDFFSKRVGESERILLDDIRKRPIPYRLRDGIARLLSPYL